ncbi:unnamed protein product [Pleuronectes platessa]|uniref:Uncharacterized protein n=1 Tax=Pleuronectes platessa TaxID=8262 RepID=A0A9N7VJH4_PLEPL|nr:unnamed protein product [Pleuronectes platessa]
MQQACNLQGCHLPQPQSPTPDQSAPQTLCVAQLTPDLPAVPKNAATPPALSDAIVAHCQQSSPGQGGVAAKHQVNEPITSGFIRPKIIAPLPSPSPEARGYLTGFTQL